MKNYKEVTNKILEGKSVREVIAEEACSFDNGYGTTYNFEVVDKIPKGYEIWNIDFNNLDGDLVPLCQVYGDYKVNVDTLKAIHVPNVEDRKILKYAAARGFKGKNPRIEKAKEIIKSLS